MIKEQMKSSSLQKELILYGGISLVLNKEQLDVLKGVDLKFGESNGLNIWKV